MRFVEGGTFTMGSAAIYPEEAPRRQVKSDSFWTDETRATNAQFVVATGDVTVLETAPDPKDYPCRLPGMARRNHQCKRTGWSWTVR